MNFAMTEDIRHAIEKNLTADVGGMVRERLEQAETLEGENVELLAKVETLSDDNHALDKRLSGIVRRENEVEATIKELHAAMAALAEKDRTLEIAQNINTVRAECVAAQLEHSNAVLDRIFGNQIIRTHVQESIAVRRSDRDASGGDDIIPTTRTTETEEA